MADYFLASLFGFVYGCIFTTLFIQMKHQAWQFITGGTGLAGLIGAIIAYQKAFNTPLEMISGTACFFVFFSIFGVCVLFHIVLRQLKGQLGDFPVTAANILLGDREALKRYDESLRHDIELRYEKEKNSFEDKQRQLIFREDEVNKKEVELNEKQKVLEEMKSQIYEKAEYYISLPEQNDIVPIASEFIKQIPEYVDHLVTYINMLHSLTMDFINAKSDDDPKNNFELLEGFFLALCTYTVTVLCSSSPEVRVHFRYLKGDTYEKLIVCYDGKKRKEPLTPIKIKEGLIYQAGILRRSLIQSLNPDSAKRCKNYKVWKDYITIPFPDFYYNDYPYITMGISVKDAEKFKNLLYFLNYVQIERIVQHFINKFNETINITDTIKMSKGEGIA